MLDIRFIRENQELVAKSSQAKGYQVDVAAVLAADDARRELQTVVDGLRAQRNENAAKMKNGKPTQELIDEGKRLKVELSERESYLATAESEVLGLLSQIPNVMQPDVPLGGEADSVEIKQVGEQSTGAVDHRVCPET